MPASSVRRLPLAIALVASLWLVFRDGALVGDKPFVEDAFYSLGVARHLGTGGGFSIDGESPTNGVQPLWVVLTAPLYALTGGERVLTLRLVHGLLALLWAATILGLGRIARLLAGDADEETADRAAVTASLLAAGAPYLWRNAFNGLETGLHLCAVTWFVLLYVRTAVTWRGRALLGVVLGLMVLVRIDVPFLVVLLAGLELLRTQGRLGARVVRAGLLSGIALLVSSPWWIYNHVVFGSLMPTSGQATGGSHWGEWGSTRLMFDAVFTGAVPPLWAWTWEAPFMEWLRALLVVPLLGWVGMGAVRRDRGGDDRERAFGRVQLALLLWIVALAVWYLARSRMNFFYGRYLIPSAVVGVPAAGYVLARGVERLGSVGRGLWWLGATGAAAMGVLMPTTAAVWGAGNLLLRHHLTLIEEHVPDGERVGAWQSGTVSYFRDGVVNMDGKVNPDLIGYAIDRRAWLEREGIDWVCEDRYQLRLLLGPKDERAPWVFVAKRGHTELWHHAGD